MSELAQQRLVVDRLHAVSKEVRRRHIGIVSDDACAPWRQELRDARADTPEADDAQRLAAKAVRLAAAEIVGEVFLRAPFAGAHVGVALAQLLQRREHHRHRGLGDAEAIRLGRRVADHDAEIGGGVGIDVVDADGVFGDDAQPLRGLHDAPADGSVPHRGAHQRNGVARGVDHGVFMGSAR